MKKIIILITICSILFTLCACSETKNVVQKETYSTGHIDGIDKVTQENSAKPTDTKIESTEKDETQPTVPETVKDIISIDDIENVGKELVVYGDVNKEIVKNIEKYLGSYSNNISLVAYSLDGEKAVAYNTNGTFFSACTIKIAYMLHCCQEIEAGNFSKDEIMKYEERHYHGGSGRIRYNGYGKEYSIEYLITESLRISDNVAYKMLLEKFGLKKFNEKMIELGCDSLKVNNMWASSSKTKDFIKVWNEVYKYFETGSEMSKILKKACTNTPFNYGTKTLKEYNYSHKSGDNFGANCAYNDAGIVWSETPYIYAIFTKSEGTNYDETTVNNIMDNVKIIMVE